MKEEGERARRAWRGASHASTAAASRPSEATESPAGVLPDIAKMSEERDGGAAEHARPSLAHDAGVNRRECARLSQMSSAA